jgi:hypothetical protein
LTAVSESDDDDDDSLPGLTVVSTSDDGEYDVDPDDDDWFSEVGDDSDASSWDTEELSGVGMNDTESFVDVDLDSVAATGDVDAEVVAEVSENSNASNLPRQELYDSGTTRHISPYRKDFENYTEITPKSFTAANQQKFSAVGTGEMVVDVPNGVDVSSLRLTEVLYSPEVGYTLVSIGKLDECGFSATFKDGQCIIRDADDETVGQVPKVGKGLYRVYHDDDSAVADEANVSLMEFHRRVGHIAPATARKLVEKGFVTGVKLDVSGGEPTFCESCIYAKSTRKPVSKVREGERAKEFGDEVHSDLWGPAPIATLGGRKYYITFTDDNTRLTHLYLLRLKSDAFESYKQYEAWCRTHHNASVKCLHSDRGGEYLGKEFVLYLKKAGTLQKLTVHDTPQHNGVAERRNRTIVERVRALLHATGLPKFLWGEAARHVVWLMNRTTTKALTDGLTPYEAVTGKKPDLRDVCEWGEKVWIRLEVKGKKLGGRVREGRWMGVDDQSKGFRIYWPDTKSISVERNVYYDKSFVPGHLEGEESDSGEITETILASPSRNPTASSAPTPTATTEAPVAPPSTPSAPIPPTPPAPTKRVRKSSQRVIDIISGKAIASTWPSDPKIPVGVQLPKVPETDDPASFEGEGTADQIMMLEETLEEYAMLAEIGEAEALIFITDLLCILKRMRRVTRVRMRTVTRVWATIGCMEHTVTQRSMSSGLTVPGNCMRLHMGYRESSGLWRWDWDPTRVCQQVRQC